MLSISLLGVLQKQRNRMIAVKSSPAITRKLQIHFLRSANLRMFLTWVLPNNTAAKSIMNWLTVVMLTVINIIMYQHIRMQAPITRESESTYTHWRRQDITSNH